MIRVVIWVSNQVINGKPGFDPHGPILDALVSEQEYRQAAAILVAEGWSASALDRKQVSLRAPNEEVVVGFYW